MKSPKSLPKPKKPKLFLLRRVVGDSMLPTLPPGKLVIGIRPRHIRPGDIVVVHHNGMEKIKRVQHIQADKVFVTGDNPTHSTDSHTFGWLDIQTIIARVI